MPKRYPTDPTFLDVAGATARQREFYKATMENGSASAAAKKLGVPHQNIYSELDKLVVRAARRGWTENSDMTRYVDPGQQIIGKSTLTKDEDGNLVWIKTKAELEEQKAAIKAFAETITSGKSPHKPKPIQKGQFRKDIMPTIVIGDAHIGAKADGDLIINGRDFDSHIASREIIEAIDYLVDNSPVADTALLVEVGDFTHSDSSKSETYRGTRVDMDTRYEKVMRIAAETMRYAIEKMLTKFKNVNVVIARGNHDEDTAVAIRLIMEWYYQENNRVNILGQKGFCHYIQFGKNLIGVHHGDKIKTDKLANIMPRDMPQAWAETTHRYWLVGHFHHQAVKECDNGVFVTTHGTLAPPDAWHSSMGYSSSSVMQMDIYKQSGGKLMTYCYEISTDYDDPDVIK